MVAHARAAPRVSKRAIRKHHGIRVAGSVPLEAAVELLGVSVEQVLVKDTHFGLDRDQVIAFQRLLGLSFDGIQELSPAGGEGGRS